MSTTTAGSIPTTAFDDIPLPALDYYENEFAPEHFAVCVSALPRKRYRAAFEIGCATGLMTVRLARRCDEVVAIDPSEQLLEAARARCKDVPGVQFAQMTFPDQKPDRLFDLVLFVDIGYMWTLEDLDGIYRPMIELLVPGGHLMMSHEVEKYPKLPISGNDVHDRMMEAVSRGNGLKHVMRRESWIGYDPEWSEEQMAKAIETYGICHVCGSANIPRLELNRLDIFERV